MSTTDTTIDELEKFYCPPIDSALFFALVSDFDLSSETSLADLKAILDPLKETADAEAASEFDPSGSSAFRNHDDDQSATAVSETTGTNELPNSVASLTLSDTHSSSSNPASQGSREYDRGIDDASDEEKLALLHEIFPSLKGFEISSSLKRNKSHFGRTVDELMTHAFIVDGLDQDGEKVEIPRGVDGFALNGTSTPKRKAKKSKMKHVTMDGASDEESSQSQVSKWDKAKHDIEFIVERTSFDEKDVASRYHRCDASLSKTLLSLCAKPPLLSETVDLRDSEMEERVLVLNGDFPKISQTTLAALIRMTYPYAGSARELAEAVLAPEAQHVRIRSSDLTPRYKEYNYDSSSALPQSNIGQPSASSLGSNTSANYALARSQALASASAAYRKSRSNPLMGGAASYYASEAARLGGHLASERSSQADALVAGQSSANKVDLHGVVVTDATRIALWRTENWWRGRSEFSRAGKAMDGDTLVIVTGRGVHSEGGRGKLGPAVEKALKDAGWRTNRLEGSILVTGRARR